MIYLKMRADSKQDGIKHEQVISPRPVFAVDKGEHDYVHVSASASQTLSWSGREIWKIVHTSGKILAMPL